MSSNHQRNKGEVIKDSEGVTHGIIESYNGPFPHPDLMEKYEKIQNGAANRILVMAEVEQKHRHKLE